MIVRVLLPISLFLLSITSCSLSTALPREYYPVASTQTVTGVSSATSIPKTQVTDGVITSAPTNSLILVTKTTDKPDETLMPVQEKLTIKIVYDNNNYDERLKSAWGFSALVEYRGHTLLFDTGGDGQTLMENMRILGTDPTHIESVVLSHAHGDHTGGLSALLEAGSHPVVYLLPTFPAAYKYQVEQFTQVVEVSPGYFIADGIFSTGEMGKNIPEQALVIQTGQGMVVITGCSHPGIIEILEHTRENFAEPLHLVLGGFHLGGVSKAEIERILLDFRRLAVKQVAPCHCTGEQAIAMFSAEYGEDFIQAGVGKVFHLEFEVSD